ncbi:MAG: Glycogen synthase [Candidatus Woesearchaeota archaeon]|nr:Glycogen synthase [Candidatus Woesearchaeota archaeon]
MKAEADFLFEVSWEVCNKVGGIYTVVKSKVNPIKHYYKQNYYVIGPYFVEKAAAEFQEMVAPDHLKEIFQKLKKEGIICHYGTWMVPGEPKTILIDFSGYFKHKNNIKRELWDNFKIDSLHSPFSFDEPIVWSFAVGRLLEEICELSRENQVVQCHEWLSGAALLYLKSRNVKIGTVFTTHATMLGRTITGVDENIYELMGKIDPDQKARELGVIDKHQMETQCAKHADVFTTVSEVTGLEAEALLGRKPDVLLLNGLDIEKFPTLEESTFKHRLFKEKLKEFAMYYFFPHHKFDIQNTLIYFLAGRYEFHDKGIDVFIHALSELNQKLKKAKSKKTILAFIWVPGNIRGIKSSLLENKTTFTDIKDSIEDSSKQIQQRIIYSLVSQKAFSENFLLGKDLMHDIKRKVMKFTVKKNHNPPLSTHNLHNEHHDPIINSLKAHKLLNKKSDKVKIVFYPIYLTGADRLLDLSYYECMSGSHLGVFPSYYEPWGYTPLEAGALGVASVTTDCAGFGKYVQSKTSVTQYPGVYVLERHNRPHEKVVKDLTKVMFDYSKLTQQERIENKIQAKKLAALADWKKMVENYLRAHNLAVEKVWN